MKLGHKLKKVSKPRLDGFKVYLEFKDGDKGTVSLDSIFSQPKNQAAEILVGQMFEQCFIESGALAWPNGFELCPDFLFQELLKTKSKVA